MQPIATRIETDDADEAPLEEIETIAPRVDRRQGDRREGERRGMDTLRAEALKAVISRVEDRNFGGLRDRFQWGRGVMAPSRMLMLGVAVVAAGLAAFLAVQRDTPAVAATMPVEIARAPVTQILVAKQAIGVGQKLGPATIGWEDWPDSSVHADYITAAATPEAITEMTGAMARGDFFAGEPIRQQKLATAGGGFLSALLAKGMRAVSVTVAAESASGGFVVPNDRVDVVLTRQSDTTHDSETILSNVRVLAVNTRLGPTNPDNSAASESGDDPGSEAFSDHAIATLELDPTQAEVIMNARSSGSLSLVLRPAAEDADAGSAAERAANAQIRMTSPFWTKP